MGSDRYYCVTSKNFLTLFEYEFLNMLKQDSFNCTIELLLERSKEVLSRGD